MKILIAFTSLLLTSFCYKENKNIVAPKKNPLIGTCIFKKVSRTQLENCTNYYMKDKLVANQVNNILSKTKLKPEICIAIWDDGDTWCKAEKTNKKSDVCFINNIEIKNKPCFSRYVLLYNCASGELYSVTQLF